MEEFKKILIDVHGGDNPEEVIKGAVLALNKMENIKIMLVGEQKFIENVLENENFDKKRLEIVNTTEIITCEDVPTIAVKQKKDSSLCVGLDLLRKNDDIIAMISTGSTGAVLTGGFLKIGRIKGVSRPALCPLIPTVDNKQVLLIDCGANVDCKPINLCHFALMGKAYMQSLGVENPRVALLNIGTEDEKGNEFTKKVFPVLKQLPINFVGNMEARDLLSGKYDVVVTDGFNGNILLKSTEGAIKTFNTLLKQEIKSRKLSLFGALFMKKSFKALKDRLDYEKHGGSPFLGCKKTLIKAHGSSKAYSIYQCVVQALKFSESSLNEKIEKIINENEITIEE